MSTSHALLPVVVTTISSTLASLRTPPAAPSSTSDEPRPTTSTIRSDLVSILSLVSQQTTNLTLALKPPADETAAFATLDKVRELVTKLRFLAELLSATGVEEQGELARRLRWSLIESLESLSSFLSTAQPFLPSPTTENPTSTPNRNHLLSSHKTLWQVVDKIKSELPETELAAVRTSWQDTINLLQDCEQELHDLSLEAQDEEEEGPAQEVVQGCATLLKLSRGLVKRLLTLTATPPLATTPTRAERLPRQFDEVEWLASLTRLVKQLSEKADDLAVEVDEVERDLVEQLNRVGDEIVEMLRTAFEDRSDTQLEQWFDLWRVQRDKAFDQIVAGLV
ncbi:uncharacterized protein JCM15063_001659 [Sporobolomyces koalae]|uniref:uncharacterized protein n=1 Tax=Sporobolomyces koalae TaxID=500713 RepID=UPI0031767311